uniref:Intracellular sulfur oxidation protein DsrL n=1 Tax=uncultured bacterium ws156A7 TaxID=1131828 RepID=I1X4S7_9BACT|nr:intracellular sulfur oxidation protein DsrL [uncultured bacterium ws156A7]
MAASADDVSGKLTFRAFKDGDHRRTNWQEAIFEADHTHKCPTYVHRTPPCQGSCPSGEDIRGWLDIVRGIEKPPEDVSWQEYAFRRSTAANPFPAMMGRVCPAPCEDGCNRNNVEDFVGINSVEQFIGDTAHKEGYAFVDVPELGSKRVAVVGGGPAGLSAAYHLRRKGHASTIFDFQPELGGMMRYGIPGYRTPRDVLDHEIERILDMGGIEVRTGVRVGEDLTIEELEQDFHAVVWTVGCQSGRALPVPNGDAPNCVSGVKFLDAFNKGTLRVTADRVICVGGGDTSIDVVSVARRLGKIELVHEKDRPEDVIGGYMAHDAAHAAARQGADVTLTALFKREQMTAAQHEVHDAMREGVRIINGVMPTEVVLAEDGRACALKLAECETDAKGVPSPVEGSEFEIECDLIVAAIGQGGDLNGLEALDNGRGLIDADKLHQVPGCEGHFVAGDIVRPHLLTTAIGQGSVAADSIDQYLKNEKLPKRPRVDVHHFSLLNKLRETGLEPEQYDHTQAWGTASGRFAVHNFEDRSAHEVIPSDRLFLAHFQHTPRNRRASAGPDAEQVLGHFEERHIGLTEEQAQAEANRCMSCGMCFECDNCVIYCPQDAVFRVKKNQSTLGRYVETDYTRCIGCHICAEVCPSGYIDMGMGE